MAQFDLFLPPKRPWNTARIIGPKPPFKPKHIWGIRQQMKANGRVRDLAMFNCAIDAKLRGCDLVKLRVSDVAPGGLIRARATSSSRKRVNRFHSRSRSRREMLWPCGSTFEAAATTTGCFLAAVVRAGMSAPGSTLD